MLYCVQYSFHCIIKTSSFIINQNLTQLNKKLEEKNINHDNTKSNNTNHIPYNSQSNTHNTV